MSELRIVADMMALAARTAPKSLGKDFVVIRIIEGEAVKALAQRMLAYGQQTGKKNFDRDGANVAAYVASRQRPASAASVPDEPLDFVRYRWGDAPDWWEERDELPVWRMLRGDGASA